MTRVSDSCPRYFCPRNVYRDALASASELPDAVRLLCFVASHFMRDEEVDGYPAGVCWPGEARLAGALGVSQRTVRDRLADAVFGGYLIRRSRGNQHRMQAAEYLAAVPTYRVDHEGALVASAALLAADVPAELRDAAEACRANRDAIVDARTARSAAKSRGRAPERTAPQHLASAPERTAPQQRSEHRNAARLSSDTSTGAQSSCTGAQPVVHRRATCRAPARSAPPNTGTQEPMNPLAAARPEADLDGVGVDEDASMRHAPDQTGGATDGR